MLLSSLKSSYWVEVRVVLAALHEEGAGEASRADNIDVALETGGREQQGGVEGCYPAPARQEGRQRGEEVLTGGRDACHRTAHGARREGVGVRADPHEGVGVGEGQLDAVLAV